MDKLIPLSVLDQHTIVLGKTGAGKSFAVCGLVERLLDDKRRVCIVTSKGDWWGLKSNVSGKSAGYPVVIFGGPHSDIPINPRVGKEIAELVATGNRPCAIQFHGWMPSDRTRFWIDFASTLFNLNRAPLWLVIDEVHNFAPQGKVLDVEAGKSLHWTNRIASEGRGIGIRLLMTSQRPQKVHKDTVTCAETLIAMRVIHVLDREADKQWMDGAGNPERSKMVMDSLAEMKRGEAFVWSPEIKFFERVKFPPIKSFDSFRAPDGGESEITPKTWASVNLDDVKKKLAAAVEEAKANDPALLKKRIFELEHQLKKGGRRPPDESVIANAIERTKAETLRSAVVEIKRLQAQVDKQNATMKRAAEMLVGAAVSIPKIQPVVVPSTVHVAHVPQREHTTKAATSTETTVTGEIDRRILDTIATLNVRGITVTKDAVARWMGIHPNGGRFTTNLTTLRSEGYLNGWELTDKGVAEATVQPTGFDAAISAIHDESRRKVLKAVAEVGPVSKEQLAEHLGIHPNGGRFTTNLAWLRDMGVITERGPIELTEGCKR